MSMPDGKPLSIVARLSNIKDMSQVAGPDFMLEMLDKHRALRHFFYGSTEETLRLLGERLRERFPGLNIAGTFSPPFRSLQPQETNQITATINQAKPDIIWVGLGAPKQEYWMADNWEQLRPAILMGVGAAFDFHAGTLARAPEWMRMASIEWLYRLLQEPRRLWKRYLVTNSLFLYYLIIYAVSRKLLPSKK
jgi:N-acetylglucosaminyldiphosphoundecaprenol N-acetyl-beta-D-mannosaminyltransferase